MMHFIVSKFHNLSSKERKQIIFLLASIVLAGYFFWVAAVWEKLFEARRFADRRENRIETKVGDVNPPELKNEVNEKRLKTLESQLEQKEQQLAVYVSKLLPLSDHQALQNHKLNITLLAEDQGLEIRSFISDTQQSLQKPASNNLQILKHRPRFKIEATGGYYQLVDFLDGLNQLSYLTRIENLSIKGGGNQPLSINFELLM